MNKERLKQQERRQQAMAWSAQQPTSSILLFKHLQETDVRGKRIFIACRVSTPKQQKDLAAQVLYMRRVAEASGAIVVGIKTYIVNGTSSDYHRQVGEDAQETGAEAVLFESVCRAIRSPLFGPNNHHAQPTQEQLFELSKTWNSFQVVTYVSPTAPLSQVRSHQIQRGLMLKSILTDRKGRRRRNKLFYRVIVLDAEGCRNIDIAKELCIDPSVVSRWLQRLKALPYCNNFSVYSPAA